MGISCAKKNPKACPQDVLHHFILDVNLVTVATNAVDITCLARTNFYYGQVIREVPTTCLIVRTVSVAKYILCSPASVSSVLITESAIQRMRPVYAQIACFSLMNRPCGCISNWNEIPGRSCLLPRFYSSMSPKFLKWLGNDKVLYNPMPTSQNRANDSCTADLGTEFP